MMSNPISGKANQSYLILRIISLVALTTFMFLSGCAANSQSKKSFIGLEWSINTSFIRKGCPGKDCIPSLKNPNRSTSDGKYIEFLDDNELVVGVRDGDGWTAYPHSVLDWHEIINESGYSISYCPLTGSALNIRGDNEFGVSGLLYNSNLIMYDRETDSYWPQLHLASAAGDLKDSTFALQPLLETTWKTWKSLFPDTKVINSQTNHSRNYDFYPYGKYRSCNTRKCKDYLFFPIAYEDDRLPAKERVLALVGENGNTKAFSINHFKQPVIIRGDLDGQHFNAIISGEDNIAIAFFTDDDLSIENWDIDHGTISLKSSKSGESYNILGNSINTSGNDLRAVNGFIAYWFSVIAFYPNTELFQ